MPITTCTSTITTLGGDTNALLGELGYTNNDIDLFRNKGIV